MQLLRESRYVDEVTDFRPLPQHGHLSHPLDPEWEKVSAAVEDAFGQLWGLPSWEAFREASGSPDAAIPLGGPDRYREIQTEILQFSARDGCMIELKVYRPIQAQSDATLMLRTHGGGWVVGGHETDGAENVYAAARHNIVVVSVLYRKAPEHPFPQALHDSYDALLWCKRNASLLGINPEKIIVGGSSAGANIAAALALEARDNGINGIIAQVLHFPTICHPKYFPKDKYEFGSYIQNKEASVLNIFRLESFAEAYMPDPRPDPRHSPLLAETLRSLPPALIQCGGLDILRDDAFAYGQALREANVEVDIFAYQGLPHCFPSILPSASQTKTFYERYNAFLDRYSTATAKA